MMEILVATALMLTIMLAVAWVFGMVGETIADSRSSLEMTGQLRGVAARLKKELDGITVTMLPPRDPASNEGYFEITEGAIGPVIPPQVYNPDTGLYQPLGIGRNTDRPRVPTAADPDPIPYEVDTAVGDVDDILMFTTGASGEPFIGQMVVRVDPAAYGLQVRGQDDWNGDVTPDDYAYVSSVIQAEAAEVAYFVRDGTLYRRQLLVIPDFPQIDLDERNPGTQTLAQMSYAKRGFYNNDVSIRDEWYLAGSWTQVMAANTLGDLTKRENRFAHRPRVPRTLPGSQPAGSAAGFPYHPHWWYYRPPANPWQPLPTHWGTFVESTSPSYVVYTGLGLPTLEECSHPLWDAVGELPNPVVNATLPSQLPLTPSGVYDVWNNSHPYGELNQLTGSMLAFSGHVLPRVGEDVVLTNVVGFDVKVWDPNALVLPAIDARGVMTNLNAPNFYGQPGFSNPGDPNRHGIIPGVAVTPGDLGYWLSMAHYLDAHPGNPLGNWAINTGMERYWPIGYGAYVDLSYGESAPLPVQQWTLLQEWTDPLGILPDLPQGGSDFSGPGEARSQLRRVYDTWSTHYESNWLDSNLNGAKDTSPPAPPPSDLGNENYNQDGSGNDLFDEGTDGVDNDGNGMVDDPLEQEAPPPYPVPLRGIQIKIRVFDPDSRQVRERTVICDFLPK